GVKLFLVGGPFLSFLRFAVERQHVVECYDTEKLMDIGAADYRQRIEPFLAHAFECGIQRMVGVEMWELPGRRDSVKQSLALAMQGRGLDGGPAHNADDSARVANRKRRQRAPFD